MKTLIIGAGEVGSSLKRLIEPHHETFIRDVTDLDLDGVEVLQICYPYSENFVAITKGYIEKYKPILVVINSSVKIGTTLEIGREVVYSPVRGRHPNLTDEMRVYPKFIACKDPKSLEIAFEYFKACGLIVYKSDNPDAFEFCKLISNIHMGLEIAWRQEVERMLEKLKIDALDYEEWERTYSQGYIHLSQEHLVRPRMRPNKIGGHCILPCTEIMSESFQSKLFDFIKESNDKVIGGKNAT